MSALQRVGLSFAAHNKICGCIPDILFVRERLAIFVDGDFWHGRILTERGTRTLAKSFRSPVRDFWVAKIARNVQRDLRQVRRLRRNGWAVVRLWEKDILRDVDGAVLTITHRIRIRRTKLRLPPNVS